jgi:hypothetical protein
MEFFGFISLIIGLVLFFAVLGIRRELIDQTAILSAHTRLLTETADAAVQWFNTQRTHTNE